MKRKYNKEFKEQACRLVVNEGVKHKVVAERLGINVVMLYRWIDEYETYGKDAFVGKGNLRPEEKELKKLRKENEFLKMENDILKKAAAYFAKHPELK